MEEQRTGEEAVGCRDAAAPDVCMGPRGRE